MVKFRLDGFASIDTFDTEGVLTTLKLTFNGNRLLLNVNASGEDTLGRKNFVKVELLDEMDRSLDGFTAEDCDPIHVDDVNHIVTWWGKSDVSSLVGRVIRIRIHMKGAELYALQFTDDS